MAETVTVIGGGLAGTECAYQLARRGFRVVLREMKPHKRTPAQKGDKLAELVCSNSFRSDNPESAIGLLHAELRKLGSLILTTADQVRVPAGDALAVDRERFSDEITAKLKTVGGVELVAGEVEQLPEGTVVIATGPLTSDALTRELERYVGEKLYFYDSIAPIVSADSIDLSIAFRQSRYGKGGGDDYLNLPMNAEEYYGLREGAPRGGEGGAARVRGAEVLRGLSPDRGDGRARRRRARVRPDEAGRPAGPAHRQVAARGGPAADGGRARHGLQPGRASRPGSPGRSSGASSRPSPGSANAEFLRMGQIHRNTFIDVAAAARARPLAQGRAAAVLRRADHRRRGLRRVGRLRATSSRSRSPRGSEAGSSCRLRRPPRSARSTATSPARRTRRATSTTPTNVIFGLFPPLEGRVKKMDKRAKYSERGAPRSRGLAPERARRDPGLSARFPVVRTFDDRALLPRPELT